MQFPAMLNRATPPERDRSLSLETKAFCLNLNEKSVVGHDSSGNPGSLGGRILCCEKFPNSSNSLKESPTSCLYR
jgi:hypothetical protein